MKEKILSREECSPSHWSFLCFYENFGTFYMIDTQIRELPWLCIKSPAG